MIAVITQKDRTKFSGYLCQDRSTLVIKLLTAFQGENAVRKGLHLLYRVSEVPAVAFTEFNFMDSKHSYRYSNNFLQETRARGSLSTPAVDETDIN